MRSPAAFISKPRVVVFVACLGILGARSLDAASLLETMDSEVSSLYQKSKEAIVRVHAQRALLIPGLPFGQTHRAGTGFFIDGQGRLLTAATVVDDAESCWIEWNGQRIAARILGSDPETNLALLQVDPEKCVGADHQMPFLAEGNSDELKVGSMVIAIGFPYDRPSAPSVGFVGGFDIRCGSRQFMTSHFRAGCKLVRGEGGGPLLNTRGEVVGIAVAMSGDDQCYALPINAAKRVATNILQDGRVQHGWVGLNVSERRIPSASLTSGQWQVLIQQVHSNSPAAGAGFRDQDILLNVDTNCVHRSADILNAMFLHRCGEQIEFTVLRDGQTQQVTVVIGVRPAAEILMAQQPPQLPSTQPGTPRLNIVPVSGPQH
ncbi:MAG: trypsin-like peptidase domain-containing protein [Verrucomicrobiia bacterium]